MTSPHEEWIDVGPRYSAGEPGYVHKFQRAVSHLNSLTRVTGDFIADGLHAPTGGKLELQQDGWVILRPGPTNPPPGVIPLCLGDFLTNARASLDHLVYDLVRANGDKPGRHTSFPICETFRRWKEVVSERDPRAGPAPTAGVSEDALAIILDEQPLRHKPEQAKKNDPLMHLDRMCNADKHRRLHVAAIETGKVIKVWAEPEGVVEITSFRPASIGRGWTVKGDREVARVKVRTVPGADPDTDVYFGFQRPAQIAFSLPGEGWKASLDDLFGIVNSIMRIGRRLESHVTPGATWFADLYSGAIGGGHRRSPRSGE
jgi:hypothetical protein